MSLDPPYEYLEMKDGETLRLQIIRWSEGQVTITPRSYGTGEEKTINAIRLFLAPGYKDTVPNYWDITSQHLVAHLKGLLTRADWRDKVFIITKLGTAPKARFMVAMEPAA